MLLTLHLLSNPVPTPKIAHNTRYFDFLIAVMPIAKTKNLSLTVIKN